MPRHVTVFLPVHPHHHHHHHHGNSADLEEPELLDREVLEQDIDEAVDLSEGSLNSDSESEDIETFEKPKPFLRSRRGAVCSEPIVVGYYKEPFWNKQESWDAALFKIIQTRPVFKGFADSELKMLVRVMSSHFYYEGEQVFQQGETADGMDIVLQGTLDCHRSDAGKKPKVVGSIGENSVVDEIALVWNSPRSFSAVAREQCILTRLTRNHFMNAIVRVSVYRWWGRQSYLRAAGLLEMMEDEQIAKLVDVIKIKRYAANDVIIRQGDVGNCIYVLNSGDARCWVVENEDEQEYRTYHTGELFGELSLLSDRPRAANITAVTNCECLVLTRGQFERLLGPMAKLHANQYLTDPRKLIADFYAQSDDRGPAGTLKLQDLEPDPTRPPSSWFVVYRPTSKDAIAKMLSGMAVGKGLNVKGKSAKQGVLSGFVPFLQISDNKHKSMIEQSPPNARLTIYYKTKATREEARKTLQSVMDSATGLKIQRKEIEDNDDYDPKVFGLTIPEPLCREAYIMRPDLSPVMGWEVGRRSEPAFMDMNLHAVRDDSRPKVVLFQYDESEPMNPRGLLIAYAEELCKPVVSDFDTFTVASRGIEYSALPPDQQSLIMWGLDHTEKILCSLDHSPWTSRWLEVLKKENEAGFHPKFPKYGYGDPTSYSFIGDIVDVCQGSGAVRHGAECFNFYFPQELDDEYLLIWEGFAGTAGKPWEYATEKQMREFLLERIKEGFIFPINPIWPIRDKGWIEVMEALLASPFASVLKAWYPDSSGILDRVQEMHDAHPGGFMQSADQAAAAADPVMQKMLSVKPATMPGSQQHPPNGGKADYDAQALIKELSTRSIDSRGHRKGSKDPPAGKPAKKGRSMACCIQ